MTKLSIIIPVLNEGKNIAKLVEEIKKEKKFLNLSNLELIIIDDNSTDDSEIILRKIKKKNKFLKYYVRKNKKKDLTKSCLLGFNKALYPNILVMDGDLQHPPKFIKHMLNIFISGNYDFVIGTRNLLKKKDPGLSYIRYVSSLFIIIIINFLLGNKTKDPMSGFFIFKKEIYKKNKKNLYGVGYKILADLIYSSNNTLKITDKDIFFDKRRSGKSKMNIWVLFQLIIFIIIKSIKRF
jgi:dolichol-phosphate mannosyltransferase|tara:strand:+ start:3543 stop:4256 length:714 start_codon:yes stop_codon:yes gene_type:complete